MTQKLSPAAAREIWAVLAREAKPSQPRAKSSLISKIIFFTY